MRSRDRFEDNDKNVEERRKRQRKKWNDYEDVSSVSDKDDARRLSGRRSREPDDLSKSEKKKKKKKARYVTRGVVCKWRHFVTIFDTSWGVIRNERVKKTVSLLIALVLEPV